MLGGGPVQSLEASVELVTALCQPSRTVTRSAGNSVPPLASRLRSSQPARIAHRNTRNAKRRVITDPPLASRRMGLDLERSAGERNAGAYHDLRWPANPTGSASPEAR